MSQALDTDFIKTAIQDALFAIPRLRLEAIEAKQQGNFYYMEKVEAVIAKQVAFLASRGIKQ